MLGLSLTSTVIKLRAKVSELQMGNEALNSENKNLVNSLKKIIRENIELKEMLSIYQPKDPKTGRYVKKQVTN